MLQERACQTAQVVDSCSTETEAIPAKRSRSIRRRRCWRGVADGAPSPGAGNGRNPPVAARTGDGEWDQQSSAAAADRSVCRRSSDHAGHRTEVVPSAGSVSAVLDAVARAKESAHLSGIELSKRAGLSLRTIKNIESGTGFALAGYGSAAAGCGGTRTLGKMYWTIQSPKIMPIQRRRQLQLLHSSGLRLDADGAAACTDAQRSGGHIEQTNAYLEHRSALAYVSMP